MNAPAPLSLTLVMTPHERARRAHTLVLKRLSLGMGGQIAEAMGIAPSTVSELKNKHLENVLLLLAHLDLKVVPTDTHCVSPNAFALLKESHEKLIRLAPHMVWDGEDGA
jgi:hypothetical protein